LRCTTQWLERFWQFLLFWPRFWLRKPGVIGMGIITREIGMPRFAKTDLKMQKGTFA
jgi:hypothetical protein